MKRLAFLMIVGLVAANLASRQGSRATGMGHPSKRTGSTVETIVYNEGFAGDCDDDEDRDDDSTTIVIKRNRPSGERPRHLEAPVPPKPPMVSRVKTSSGSKETRSRQTKASQESIQPQTTPDWFPRDHDQEIQAAQVDSKGRRILVGPLSASPSEALDRLRTNVRGEVFRWLTPEMETIWEPSDQEIQSIVVASHVQPVLFDLDRMGVNPGMTLGAAGVVTPSTENLYTIYKAGQVLDFSEKSKQKLIRTYQSRLVRDRLFKGGGVLGFALLCLATLTGYIRADEATKGYYTKRLRLVATAGVGVAGFALYRWLS